MIRLLLPSLLGITSMLIILWLIYYAVKKYVVINADVEEKAKEEGARILKVIFRLLTAIMLVCYAFYVLNIISVNEVPRTDIDHSAQQEGKQNFEDRLLKDTTTIKNK